MRVLVTGSRMPFALAIIRKLAEEGHEVLAADAWSFSPGSHSRYVTEHFVTGSPRDATEKFIDDVERIAGEQKVDVIVPAFEEVFYLSTQWERLAKVATPFFSPVRDASAAPRQGDLRAGGDRDGPADGPDRDRPLGRGAARGPRAVPGVLRPRCLLARRGEPAHQLGAACRAARRLRLPSRRRQTPGSSRSSSRATRSAPTAPCTPARSRRTAPTRSRGSGSTRPGSSSAPSMADRPSRSSSSSSPPTPIPARCRSTSSTRRTVPTWSSATRGRPTAPC